MSLSRLAGLEEARKEDLSLRPGLPFPFPGIHGTDDGNLSPTNENHNTKQSFNVGTYTVRPMDGMGSESNKFVASASQDWESKHSPQLKRKIFNDFGFNPC